MYIMRKPETPGWEFTDAQGAFRLEHPERTSYLYFPLVNEAGIFSAVSPLLGGDIKADHNTFLTEPGSVEDLHASRAGRAFWVYVHGQGAWCATGGSAAQTAARYAPGPEEQPAGQKWVGAPGCGR